MRLRFALLAEGSSERGLIPHLEALCVDYGAAEAVGVVPSWRLLVKPPGKTIAARLEALTRLEPDLDFVVVHRDADAAGFAARRAEILASSRAAELPLVACVPVTELEAWLLLDEPALFQAAGQPFRGPTLPMSSLRQVEAIRDPKAMLRRLLADASGASGRRRKQERRDFPRNRAFLLERLDIYGPVSQLPAWRSLCHDLEAVVTELLGGETVPRDPTSR